MYVYTDKISFHYGDHQVLNRVSITLNKGEVASVIGPNGVGKSTLIKCMTQIIKPQQGVIYLNGHDLFKIHRKDLAQQQAYVPQNTSTAFPLTVLEMVMLGRKPYVNWSLTDQDKQIVSEVMTFLEITSMANKYLDELSGGERQRVMLARALVQEPQVLILDEPTSALDIKHQLEVMNLLKEIAVQRDCVILLVMHDLMLVARYADQVILMKDGQIYSYGTPAETITEKNLAEVYQIKAKIKHTEDGLILIPIDSLHKAPPAK